MNFSTIFSWEIKIARLNYGKIYFVREKNDYIIKSLMLSIQILTVPQHVCILTPQDFSDSVSGQLLTFTG
jgi:hypothetical protein